MNRNSLRLRLVTAGAAAVLVSLALAAFGLSLLFERHVRRLTLAELAIDLDQLSSGLVFGPRGALAMVNPPSDPRYAQPLSGRYWQIESGPAMLRSRSLWDGQLDLPPTDPARVGPGQELILPGPKGESLLVYDRNLRLGDDFARVAVAADRADQRAAARAFLGDLAPYLALLAGLLTAAGWIQVAVGLRPLADVGGRVARVNSGDMPRLGSDFPSEVQPLAAEVDALIEAREIQLARARARAADLAHGLKTPLQALIGEAGRLRAAGADEAADGIEQIVSVMDRHVDRELARSRIASVSPLAVADPAAVLGRLFGVLRRTGHGAQRDWRMSLPDGLRLRIDPDDLTEALGALLDNAGRHGRTSVAVSAEIRGEAADLVIADDGPGIPPQHLAALTARGARLDETGSGAGLGLAIAREIAEAAGGGLLLRRGAGPAGAEGLEAVLTLPIARAPA